MVLWVDWFIDWNAFVFFLICAVVAVLSFFISFYLLLFLHSIHLFVCVTLNLHNIKSHISVPVEIATARKWVSETNTPKSWLNGNWMKEWRKKNITEKVERALKNEPRNEETNERTNGWMDGENEEHNKWMNAAAHSSQWTKSENRLKSKRLRRIEPNAICLSSVFFHV